MGALPSSRSKLQGVRVRVRVRVRVGVRVQARVGRVAFFKVQASEFKLHMALAISNS